MVRTQSISRAVKKLVFGSGGGAASLWSTENAIFSLLLQVAVQTQVV